MEYTKKGFADQNAACISLKNLSNARNICPKSNAELMPYADGTAASPEVKEIGHLSMPHVAGSFQVKMNRARRFHGRDREVQKIRMARSPVAGQIKKWKNELFEELQNTKSLSAIPCNEALYEICLKHLSCRQLWNVFRNACAVDSANKCLMTNRDDCWQAFEGLSWTGLGNCSCLDRNSDCHWIRLQTRYNKCVYEISLSGDMPSLISFLPRDRMLFENQTIPKRFQISSTYYNPQLSHDAQQQQQPFRTGMERFDKNMVNKEGMLNSEKMLQRTAPERRKVINVDIQQQFPEYQSGKKSGLQMTTTVEPELPSTVPNLLGTQLPRPKPKDVYTQTENSWINKVVSAVDMHLKEANESMQQKSVTETSEKMESMKVQLTTTSHTPSTTDKVKSSNEVLWRSRVFNAHPMSKSVSVNRTTLDAATVTAPQSVLPTKYRPLVTVKSAPEFVPKNSSTSTCVAAHNRCERFENCKWHLSEVQIRCAEYCNRQQCAAAVQRFARYVARPSVESLMFCHCDKLDEECLNYQQILYPRCLYSDKDMVSLTCTEAVEKCRMDRQCQHYSSAFFYYCPVQGDQCTIAELDHCRQAIVAIRGTYLDYPCYCPENDIQCKHYQAGMLPSNPCIEKSMIEYSRLMSDVLPNQSSGRTTASVVASIRETDSSSVKTPGDENVIASISEDDRNREESFEDAKQSGTVSPTNEKMIKDEIVASDKSKLTKASKASRPKMSKQIIPETSREKQKPVEQQQVDDEEKLDSYKVDAKEDDAESQRTEKLKSHSLAGTTYELDRRKDEELSNVPERLEKGGGDGDDDWKSGTTTVSEREVPQFQPKHDEKDDMKESEDARGEAVVDEDVKIVYAYKTTTSKQPPTAKSLQLEQPISKAVAKIRPTKTEGRSIHGQNQTQRASTSSMGISEKKQKQKSGKVSSPRIVGETYSDSSGKDAIRKVDFPVAVERPLKEKDSAKRPDEQGIKTTALPKTTKAPREHISQATATPLKNYATELPLAPGGCVTKDVYGNEVIHYKGSIFRRYHDWAGRCSSWCTCNDEEEMSCSKLPCLSEGDCQAPLTKIEYGERLYMKDRGACTCLTGFFICEQPSDFPKLNLGLYLLVGYSIDEVAMLKESVPKNTLERAGFVSGNDYIMHDIGSRLQLAMERIMPPDVQCRITLLKEYKEEGNVIYQLEWFGANRFTNESGKRWHTGKAEKVCSPYVTRLASAIMRNEAVRYELVLSTVKQIRVYDLLDGLPDHATQCQISLILIFTTFILLRFFVT